MNVRPVIADDLPSMVEITNWAIEHTAAHFGVEAISVSDLSARWERTRASFPWYAASVEDVVVGYAYSSPYKQRAAYRWTADVSAITLGEVGRLIAITDEAYRSVKLPLDQLDQRASELLVEGVPAEMLFTKGTKIPLKKIMLVTGNEKKCSIIVGALVLIGCIWWGVRRVKNPPIMVSIKPGKFPKG